VIGRGRDYADVSPLDGVILASGGQTLSVNVDVTPSEPPPSHGSRTAVAVGTW
jgi:transglutaminase-like putative cysteine protease